MVASRYVPTEKVTNSNFLAANPELMAANRYVAAETKLQRTFEAEAARYDGLATFYAQNPELMAASRYTAQVK